MIKNDLRKKGLEGNFYEPKESHISALWTILSLIIICVSFMGVLELSKDISAVDAVDPLRHVTMFVLSIFGYPMGCAVYFILFLSIYFALKAIMTILVCEDKIRSIHIKFLKGKGMPICTCKEALKAWQAILIYLVPIVIMYSALFIISVLSIKINIIYLPMLIILSFFMAFDLTVVWYVLFLKIKGGLEYISIDLHAHQMTTFSRPIVEKK